MAVMIREMIQDFDQLETSIPIMKQLISDNPTIVDKGTPLLRTAMQHYNDRTLIPYKSQYLEIIKMIIPHSTYKITTSDFEIATLCLKAGKEVDYIGSLKPELFFPPEPIPGNYKFIGHGTDTGKPIIVPPGCTYVVTTLCGVISDLYEKFPRFDKADKSELIRYAQEGNVKAIERAMNWPCHLYKEGEQITEVMFHLPALYKVFHDGVQTGDLILPGGLLPIEVPILTPLSEGPHLLTESYKNSVFPSLPILQSLSVTIRTKEDLQKNNIVVSLSDLFKHYPGIHFMIICREAWPIHAEAVALQRSISESKYPVYTLPELIGMDDATLKETIENPSHYFKEKQKGEIIELIRSKGLILAKGRLIGGKTKRRKRLSLRKQRK